MSQSLYFSSDEDSIVQVRLKRKKVFRQRINYNQLQDFTFKEKFRLRKSEVEFVLEHIGQILRYRTTKNKALTPEQQLLTTLHWLGNGGQYHGTADMHGISKANVCRVNKRVINALLDHLFQTVVSWPSNMENTSLEFLRSGGFPSVCACIDGSLFPILTPSKNESAYVDRHGDHSINAMMACGPDMNFYSVCSRWPGSTHDSRVLRNSMLFAKFERGWRPFQNAVVLGN